MSFPVALPRGRGETDERLHATAHWAHDALIERFRLMPDMARGTDAILLGAYPAREGHAWFMAQRANLARLSEQASRSAEHTSGFEGWLRVELLKRSYLVGLKDDRHLVTVAGSRAGKGRSMILPNLALYRGSVVVIDPKGENATLTAQRRADLGQKVVVLDPFKVADIDPVFRGAFNPFDLLDTSSPAIVDDAALLAEGLVMAGSERDAHWDESARNLIRALILHLKVSQADPTLKTLRRFLMEGDRRGFAAFMRGASEEEREAGPRTATEYLLMQMSESESFEGAIAGTAATILEMGENERGSVFSTAARNTGFLDSLELTETIEKSTLALDELKTAPQGLTLYLCLPAHRIGTHARWLRVMIAAALNTLYKSLAPPAAGAPVLFVLDEFAALGRIDVIEKAAGYAAGFGVKLWTILQDLSQIKALYPQSWETFLGNAGMLQVFGVSDRETTEFVSKLAGDIESRRITRTASENSGESVAAPPNQGRARGLVGPSSAHTMFNAATTLLSDKARTQQSGRSASEAEGLHVVPLIRADEIGRFFAREAGASMVILKGHPPFALPRLNRDEDQRFATLFPDTAGRWDELDASRTDLIATLSRESPRHV